MVSLEDDLHRYLYFYNVFFAKALSLPGPEAAAEQQVLLLKAFGVNGAEIPVQGSPAGSKATETWQHLLLVIWGLLTAHPETRGFVPS